MHLNIYKIRCRMNRAKWRFALARRPPCETDAARQPRGRAGKAGRAWGAFHTTSVARERHGTSCNRGHQNYKIISLDECRAGAKPWWGVLDTPCELHLARFSRAALVERKARWTFSIVLVLRFPREAELCQMRFANAIKTEVPSGLGSAPLELSQTQVSK